METLSIQVGRNEIIASADPDYDDPRGMLWLWEPPRRNANYIVSCDPSYGIAGWNRFLKRENDEEVDNGAVEVIRCGNPDVQVAEFAAPVDAEDIAMVVNFLGRMYCGTSEDEQALAIVEVQPGPGLLTQRELINRYGYTNLFPWQHLDSMAVEVTRAYGWYSSRQSRQLLWIRGTRHITQRKLIINSPWLVEEMTDLSADNFLSFTARSQWGSHDDRAVGILLGIWAANQWSFDNPAPETDKPTDLKRPDYQATDMDDSDASEEWEERVGERFFAKF